ncbi:prolyl oligopeptidase family serine peptidase [Aliifodinibius salicampi]|uniref:Prolyl oligopeptidase family serine peptidase n=1 Tax=Fodinibius salicampi TaxID=1920655 RepID=A0ABT3PUQ4_9BACT|nr:prolyl oligopeptidase family serine peptidase [Fodinibius salicampi]MCW9711585.1 prolyl oligopeptidase family serine peptidase [Fodinibius salicampi]
MHRSGKIIIGLVFFGLAALQVQAQDITKEDYQRAEQFLYQNVNELVFRVDVNPHWAEVQRKFWYRVDTRKGEEYFFVDAREEKKQSFFDQEKLAQSLSESFGEKVDPYDLPLSRLEWKPKDESLEFFHKDKKWKVDLGTLDVYELEEEEEGAEWYDQSQLSESPDGKWTVARKDYNLWVKNNETGEEYQLTEDGNKEMIYGASQPWAWKKQEGPNEKEREDLWLNVSWSPNSQKLFANKLDLRKAKLMYLLRFVPDESFRAQSVSYYRALPGEDSVAKQIPYVFDIVNKSRTRIKAGPYDDLIAGSWNWHGDSNDTLYMLIRERGYGSATLLRANAESGAVDTVFREVSDTYVDPGKSESEYLPDTDEFIWLSERDGWNHIYLYDLNTGEVKQQVTRGKFVVYDIEHIDKENRKIFFTAGGREADRDPYLEHLYSVNFDGSDLRLLTPENADHNINFSSGYNYFVDTYSRVDRKSTSVLRRSSDGKVIMKLEEADIKDLLATGWQHPEPFSVKARDGETDIYGVIYRPSNFDPNKEYPVIDGTYSGPQAVRTPKSFAGGYQNSDQPLAELGFIVITVDGLGTAGRSKEFQDYSWKNLGDIGSSDHIKAIKELAEKYTYMDTSRVGIYGHSAGGYDAARAVMKHPDFYKVAVSSAGNHDHRIAKAFWPEIYMDYPEGPHYEEQSNVNLAENLEGHLLLAHGDMDDNVHPTGTIRMADALIKAGKSFDLLIMPNEDHGMSGTDYFTKARWNYFVEHLLGAEPLRHYQIGQD